MADAKIVDIKGVQWELKDEVARNKIAEIETKTNITSEQLWSSGYSFINKVKINNEYFLQAHFEGFEYEGEMIQNIITLQKPLGNSRTLRAQMMGDIQFKVDRISVNLDFYANGVVASVVLNQGIYEGGNFKIKIYGDVLTKII